MENITKEVFFTFCETCAHKDRLEDKLPCNECLNTFYRADSHRPIFYEGKDGKK